MKREVFSLSFGLCAFLLAARALHAEDASCADRDTIVSQLAKEFGEVRQVAGLSDGGQLVEFFATEDGGSWTITVTTPTGTTCLLATGDYYERFDEALTPALLGDPV